MKNPKILICSPAKIDEPLGAMYLSSALKKAGFNVKGLLIKKEDVFQGFDEYAPDIVLYSVITGEHQECLALNMKLKEKRDFLAIFGGPHVTFVPEIIENEGVDAIGMGECEEAVVELMTKLAHGEEIARVKNFWIKRNNKITKNELRPLISNLDDMAFPDRELFSKCADDNREISVIVSRGCPYQCTYCHNYSLQELYSGKGRFHRLRDVRNIAKEIKEYKKKNKIGLINFHDDIFFVDAKRLRDFSERFKKEINVPFVCSARPEFLTEEIVALLKQAGCQKVFMGVEAGNDAIRVNLLKRKISKEQIIIARNLLKKYGITVFAQNIIGFPKTTIFDDFQTLKFNIELKPDFAWVSIFTPYPKTVLGELCLREGLLESFDDIYDSYHYKTALKLPHRLKIDILHKLFSLIVDYPELLPSLKRMLMKPGKCDFEELQEIFRLFREFKYEKVNRPDLELPDKVKGYIKILSDG